MTTRIICNSWLFRLPILRQFDAICLGRWIHFKGELAHDGLNYAPSTLLRHEMIHQQQMDRYTVPVFYLVYLGFWFGGLVKHRSFWLAYRQNPLEVEAYDRQRT